MIQGEKWKVLVGNNLDLLPTLEDNSVDSIVTDPPYELGFMGKKWDLTGIAYNSDLWRECLRVLKPGGHLLSFGGTRTWHRIAVAIEDAGFEVRDSIAWMYGSGFPKSLDISKAIDKKPEANSTKQFKLWLAEQIDKSAKPRKQIDEECGFTACSYAKTDGKDYWSTNHPSRSKWEKMKEVIGLSDEWDWIITDNINERGFIETTGGLHGGSGNTVGNFGGKQLANNPISPEAQQWEGWGTALKPAFEPIIVARKPLIGTVAENVLTYGTGGLNIDGSRVKRKDGDNSVAGNRTATFGTQDTISGGDGSGGWEQNDAGRWPANVILDEYTATLLPETASTGSGKVSGFRKGGGDGNSVGLAGKKKAADGYADGGSASRFFYVAKASKRDRNEGLEELPEVRAGGMSATIEGSMLTGSGNERTTTRQNFHPTVKPTELMRYLVKLVTPPNGLVLDPFTGSGSTGKAAILEGFSFLGMEMTEDYIPIIEGRLRHAETQVKENEGLF